MQVVNGLVVTSKTGKLAPSNITIDIARLDERAIAAVKAYEADNDSLYRPDGSHIYTNIEFKTRREAATQRLNVAMDRVKNEAIALRDAAHSAQLATQIDPLLQITNAAERDEAIYKRPFIAENVERYSLPELTLKLEAINHHGSKVERLLHIRYAGERLEGLNVKRDGEYLEGLREALEALAALQESTDSDQAAKGKAAEAAKLAIGMFIVKLNTRHQTALDPRPMVSIAGRL